MRTLDIKHHEVTDGTPTYFGRLTTDGLGYDFIAAIVSDGDGHLETLVRTASAASPSERVSISRAVLAHWASLNRELPLAHEVEPVKPLLVDDCYSG